MLPLSSNEFQVSPPAPFFLPPDRLLFPATAQQNMAAHQKISRVNSSRYCPRCWCGDCGKAATKNTLFVCCDGELDCLNVSHITCLSDREKYTSIETQQLFLEANVDATRLDDNENGDTSAATTLFSLLPGADDALEVNEDGDAVQQHYLELEKEELVSQTLV